MIEDPEYSQGPCGERHTAPSPFQQADPRWALEKLGGSEETLAEAGCLVCAVAMALTAFGQDETPATLNAKLRDLNGYTDQGWLIWRTLTSLFPAGLRVEIPVEFHLSDLERHLRTGAIPIVKVTLPSGKPHWVLVTGQDKDDFTVLDPHESTPGKLSRLPPAETARYLAWETR